MSNANTVERLSSFAKRFAAYALSLFAVASGVVLFSAAPEASAAPATCNGTTVVAGFNRERWCGFFTNTGWTDGPALRGGTYSNVPSPGGSYVEPTAANPGVPAEVDTAAEYIAMVESDLNSSDPRAVTAAQFVILKMIGVQPAPGATVPKSVTPEQLADWKARVMSYANTTDAAGNSTGVNGSVTWKEPTHLPCGAINTYYLIDQNDVGSFFTDTVNDPNCPNPAFTEEYITFRDAGGNILFQIRRICFNPAGTFLALAPAPENGTVGNQIFEDNDKDGVYDPAKGDKPIPGVTVAIYRTDSSCTLDPTQLVTTTTTDADGLYQFTNLPVTSLEGTFARYIVVVTDDNNVLARYTNTQGTPNTDNNGQDPVGYCVEISLSTPSNQTGDFGYWQPYSLGNRVWIDTNNSGNIDAADGPNPGVAGVTLALYDCTGTQIATTTTDSAGYYRFDNLNPGCYEVEVVSDNFMAGNSLESCNISSTGALQSADPNNDTESDDNGIDPAQAGDAVRSGQVTLAIGEPANETDLAPSGQGAPNDAANMTVDFGFNCEELADTGTSVSLVATIGGILALAGGALAWRFRSVR